MNGIKGDAALLADPYPLNPHITLRQSGIVDPPCACGADARFVLVEIDSAVEPPHPPDFSSRICYDWNHMLVSVCNSCLPGMLERTGVEFGV